jgi:hypothetical protein
VLRKVEISAGGRRLLGRLLEYPTGELAFVMADADRPAYDRGTTKSAARDVDAPGPRGAEGDAFGAVRTIARRGARAVPANRSASVPTTERSRDGT